MGLFNYVRSKQVADRLIRRFGQNAVLRRETSSPTDRVCYLILDPTPHEASASMTNPTDRRIYMSVVGLEDMPPDNEQDQLVLFVQPGGTAEKEVLPFTAPVKVTGPGGIDVLYEFTVRR